MPKANGIAVQPSYRVVFCGNYIKSSDLPEPLEVGQSWGSKPLDGAHDNRLGQTLTHRPLPLLATLVSLAKRVKVKPAGGVEALHVLVSLLLFT
jgi:hypothetical protein